MSLHSSFVLIKADVRPEIREVFEAFGYKPVGTEKAHSWDAATEAAEYPREGKAKNVVHKPVVFAGGWTTILDNEMVMFVEEDACSALARRFEVPVFAITCEGISGTYAFSLFNPELRRAYMVVQGEVTDDRGAPLPEEAGIDLADLFEDDVLEIMHRLGLSYEDLERAVDIDVWELDGSVGEDLDLPQLAPPPPMAPQQQTTARWQPVAPQQPMGSKSKKPWWKFW